MMDCGEKREREIIGSGNENDWRNKGLEEFEYAKMWFGMCF